MLMPTLGLIAVALFVGGGVVAAAPAVAEETDPPGEFTVAGEVAPVSDWRFRCLSKSGGDSATEGAINFNHARGFYVGAWGSNLMAIWSWTSTAGAEAAPVMLSAR